MSIDERSLSDVSVEDRSEPQTPETFDMGAFLLGVRPTRRAVTLFPHADLLARMDAIADQIERTPGDQDVDELIDEFERLKDQFNSGVSFVVEKRSSDWEREFRKETVRELGLKKVSVNPDGDLQGGSREERAQVVLHQLAAQIVEPAGVTATQLEQLGETNEGELTKLLRLMTTVNTQIAESADVMARDFSRRRSGKTATAGS